MSKQLAVSVIFLLVGICFAAGCKRQEETTPTDKDTLLIEAVKEAVADKTPAADVEAKVGQPAWINTTRPGDRKAYEMATIELDTSMVSQVSSLSGSDIAYWGRPVKSDNPKLVGIVWQSDGSSGIFFGIIYAP